jgi:hypothetical protein
MSEQSMTRSTDSARRSWRMIIATGLMAAAAWLSTSAALRALAQEPGTSPAPQVSPPVAEPPAAEGAESNEADAVDRRAPPPRRTEEEAPEFRESADNNISLPIDI